MKRDSTAHTTIDAYITAFPPDEQKVLQEVRATIRSAAPDADEAMKYGIPTFVQGENLVHFGGFSTHVGFYPTPSGIEAFKKELSAYKGAKGSVQFPRDKPMPLRLIARIVKFRVEQVQQKALNKKLVKKAR